MTCNCHIAAIFAQLMRPSHKFNQRFSSGLHFSIKKLERILELNVFARLVRTSVEKMFTICGLLTENNS